MAEEPVHQLRSISAENLQFTMKNAYANCALISPGREGYQSAGTAVSVSDGQTDEAAGAVAASLKLAAYDRRAERPAVAPGAGGVTLSFFAGGEAAAKEQFLVVNGELRRVIALEDGWPLCRYTVDEQAPETLLAALRAVAP